MATQAPTRTEGKFEVQDWKDETLEELGTDWKITHSTVTKKFQGPIEGNVTFHYLMCTKGKEQATFVAMAAVNGTVDEIKGSFALQIQDGSFDGKVAKGPWTVVPSSGTGDLKGISGQGSFEAPMGSSGTYTFEWEI